MENRKHDVISWAAIIAAICLLWIDFFGVPKSAWWGTAFSIVCGEALEETTEESKTAEEIKTEEPAVTYRWWISDWWNGKTK